MTQDDVLKKYEPTEPPADQSVPACKTCAAQEECDATSDVGCNPFFRACHDGWNLKLKEEA